MSATTSAVVLATSLAAAFGLALLIRRWDRREAERDAVAEAERIVRQAYSTDRGTWPNGGRR